MLASKTRMLCHSSHTASCRAQRSCFAPSVRPPKRTCKVHACLLHSAPLPPPSASFSPLHGGSAGSLAYSPCTARLASAQSRQLTRVRAQQGQYQQGPGAQQQQQQQQRQQQGGQTGPPGGPRTGGPGFPRTAGPYPIYDDGQIRGPGYGASYANRTAPSGPGYRNPAVSRPGGSYYNNNNMAPGRRAERLERGRERTEADVDDRPRFVAGKKVLVNGGVLPLGREVRLLGSEGEFLGVVPAEEALAQAVEEEVDLVCVNADSDPILCKLIAFSKYKYELEKRDKEAKKKQKDSVVELKEVRLRPSIDVGDLNVKLASAKKFLEKANKVKVVMSLAGRELKNRAKGQEVLQKFVTDLASVASVEGPVSFRGNTFIAVLAPLKK